MREMDFIIKNATANSLIIIDELCRSTNPKFGLSIAWILCEQLLAMNGHKLGERCFVDDSGSDGSTFSSTSSIHSESVQLNRITAPFIFLTTHELELTKLANRFLNVSK